MDKRKEIIIKITKEFFQNIEKKMLQTQALSYALENNIPRKFEEKKKEEEPKSINPYNEQVKFKFNSLIELQKLKNKKEEIRHKNIMGEIKELSKAKVRIYIRGDMPGFDQVQKEINEEQRKVKKSKKK